MKQEIFHSCTLWKEDVKKDAVSVFSCCPAEEGICTKKKPLNKALVELVFGDCALVSVLLQPHRHPQLCSMEVASALKMPACSPFTVRVAFSSHKGHVELL